MKYGKLTLLLLSLLLIFACNPDKPKENENNENVEIQQNQAAENNIGIVAHEFSDYGVKYYPVDLSFLPDSIRPLDDIPPNGPIQDPGHYHSDSSLTVHVIPDKLVLMNN